MLVASPKQPRDIGLNHDALFGRREVAENPGKQRSNNGDDCRQLLNHWSISCIFCYIEIKIGQPKVLSL